ncbi:MAG: hypothetical protein MK132_13665, partial [Lentisphaerales bacterium]|nr:hypothetical protein [Lentisphaerales bacterium]
CLRNQKSSATNPHKSYWIQLREALSTTMPKPGESRRIECRSASSQRECPGVPARQNLSRLT